MGLVVISEITQGTVIFTGNKKEAVITKDDENNWPDMQSDTGQPTNVSSEPPSNLEWINSHLAGAQVREWVDLIVGCIVIQLVLIVGIPGNVLNLLVFLKQGLRVPVILLLFVLALSDLVNLFSYALIKSACFFHRVDPIGADNWRVSLYPNVLQLNLCTLSLTNCLVALLSLDRCISITLPFKAKQWFNFRNTLAVVIFITVLLLAFYIPNFFIYSIVYVFDSSANGTIAEMVPNDVYFDHPGIKVARTTIQRLLGILSVAIVSVCSSITLVKLREATKVRRELTCSKSDVGERKITRMVVFVDLVMTCCVVPDLVVYCVSLAIPEFYMFMKYHHVFLTCQYFIFMASCISSASNFCMYVAMSTNYRRTLKAMFRTRSDRANLLKSKEADLSTAF